MNKFIKLGINCLVLIIPLCGWSQTKESITLEECYKRAVEASSIIQRGELAHDIAISERREVGSTYIPSASLNGTIGYQSDVVSIPIPIVEPPHKESYRATIDIEQVIYDGGISSKSKDVISLNLKAEQLKLDIEELSLKDRVASFFLSIELLKRNKGIVMSQIDIINNNLEKLRNLEKNGVGTKEDIIRLETSLLQRNLQLIEISSNRAKIIDMLSILIQTPLSVYTEYILPGCDIHYSEISKRPEFELFDMQSEMLEGQKKLANSSNVPKLSAYATGGNGLPGLNMLSLDPEWFYLVGLKFTVPLTNWKTTKHIRQKYTSQQSIIQEQKDDFRRNNKIAIAANIKEIEKYKELILTENEIIAKKSELLKIEEHKLENGVSTSNDYIIELNDYQTALLSQNLNEIKLIEAIINYKSNIGEN